MKFRFAIFSILLGFVMVSALLVGIAQAADQRPTKELELSDSGYAYEVNPDSEGHLWVSDYDAYELWEIDPARGVYTIYEDFDYVSDARKDSSGYVWWTNYSDSKLGKFDPRTKILTIWDLSDADSPWGVAFDDSGNVWIADDSYPYIYKFDPDTNTVCTYDYDESSSAYILYDDGMIWLGDYFNNKIVRFDPTKNEFNKWDLPGSGSGGENMGLAVDKDGKLWWASEDGYIGTFTNDFNNVKIYDVPVGSQPEKLTFQGDMVLYAENDDGTIGWLDPAVATPVITPTTMTIMTTTPSCEDLGAGITSTVDIITGTLAWSPGIATRETVTESGWTIYQVGSGYELWDIAVVGDNIYVTEQSENHLIWIPPYKLYLPTVSK